MTEQTVTGIGVTGAQAGVWYGQQLIGPSSTFVVGQTWEPHEPVHLCSLVDAISATIGEAPGLSCAFGTEDGEVVARPHAHRVDDVAVVDLSGDDDPAAAATRWMREHARTQLDPATDPCFEATVLRLDGESVQSPGHARVIVCVRAHHIVADVFALGLLGRRVGELYAAARTGSPARDAWFDPLTAVLDAESQYRASGDRGRDEDFWRDELTTVGDVTGLRPAVGGDRRTSGVLSDQIKIDGATADLLAELGARHGGSWGEAVTGILAAHIGGRAGSAGAVLGYPMMNRLGTPAFAVPTMVVNVVPLALPVDGWSTVDEVTSAAMTGIRRIRPHARFRGEDIARLGDGGLPSIWLNVKAIDDHLSFGGVDVTVHSLARGPVEELTITVRRSVTGDIELQLDADDSRYDRRRLAELAEEFADILCRAAQPAAWARPVGRTALSALPDRTVQTDPGSSTSTFADLLAEGIGEGASADRDGIAVVAGGVEVSRADLDRRVRRLAGWLVADGVMPDDRVAVLLPRDESAVVALAAVAVAGGVVVPIDPDYPADRLRHILTDSRPTVILTRRDVALPETSATIVHLDDGTWRATGSLGSEPPRMGACRIPTRPDHLSCIAYTSGSTGVPKGVMVTQAGLVNRLAWAARDWLHDDVTRGPSDRITLWKSPTGFIDGITEVFGALVRGDRIVVADGDAARDPRALVSLLDRHRVTHLTAVPSLLRELVVGDPGTTSSTVALWVSSGEPLPAAVVRQVRRFDPTARLINSYGSTEVTGDATYGDLRADDDVTIGSAVPGCRVMILDSWLRPVPVGDVGELYVGGVQLARGYHGRPEWTADRFVADPAADGARMYRTGDRAVRYGDGRIRVIGRADDQVKIRGVRVEPAEVERAVAQAAGVDEAVVVVARDAHDDPSLVAYVTAASPIDIAMVRAHVVGTLPSQMVPADIVEIATIPRSAHGKIDRRALPTVNSRPDDDATPPATPTEEAVAEAFSTVLRRGGRSRTDDFFALGGHSLLVTRLLNRLGEQFGVNLEMRDVFDRPTVAEIAEMVDRRRDDGTHAASVLPRIDDVGPRPTVTGLSAAQERLWFLFRLEGPTAAYNIPIVLRIPEEPDLAALDAALYDVIERHETLRTVIAEDDGGVAWQDVLPMDEVRWTATVMDVDAEGTDDAVRSVAAHRFDLATETPFRAVVIRGRAGAGRGTEATGSACSIVLLVHHIAGDEWSSPILVDDLSRAYLARIAGARVSPFTAAPLPVSYRDHTHWQHVVRDHPRRRDGIERWRRRLHGAPEELALPYDRPRPSITSYRGDRVAFRLDPVIADRLRRTARDRRVSMFMLLHAAVALMLSEDGAGDDIVVGTPVAGRDDAAVHGLVGFFVNMVVLRTDLGGDPTLGELIDRIRADDLDAMSLSDVPFEAVVDAVSPERAMGRHPLFGVMVQFRADWAIPDFAGLPTEVTPIDPGTAKFDLTVDVTEHSGSGAIDVRFDYATDLFDRTTAEMLARHLDRALELLGSAPDLRLSQAGLLDDDERAAVLHEWALPSSVPAHLVETERSRRVTVDDRLRTAATRYAVRRAIRFGDTVIDHAGLDRAASSVASRLRQAGVVGDDRVAVLVSRSELLPIAIAGVLRSGATCVPVDATHPDDRIEYILRDSGAVVVLTDGPTRIPVPEERARERHEGPRTVHLDRDILKPAGSDNPDPENPPPPIDPASSAMLLYTSGSTGTPKGVVLSHAALAHRIGLGESDFGIGPDSVGISKSAIGFVDASTELFGVLCAGGSVVVADDTTARDPSALAEMIRTQQVTELVTVPTMARVIADTGTLPSLRRWVCSGEALTADTARRMAACAPDATIVNLYGSTEITGDVTVHEVDGPRDVDAGVPIGRPLPGSSVYVLDHRLRPTAPGVRGELYVGGAHLADGYHGRSRETATRFIAHPFAATPGERLYRTGDLARWDRTGALHVLGRSDDQVTIRGVRIEPGEVVGTLESLPDVDGALVISTTSALTGASMLVAYVVLRQTNPGSSRVEGQALRAQLIDRLPESMIPAAVMIVDRFPMTPNGKIDRRALPASEVDTATRHREPSTDREGILREIVAGELGLGPDRIGDVGVDDDFFALGGDSIASLRVVAAAVRAGIAVTSRQMLELRTVAALAAAAGDVVDSGEGSAGDDGSPSTTADDFPIPVPPNAVVQRLRASGRAVDDCVVTAVVHLDTPPDGGAVAQAVDAAIRRHDALRLRVTPKNKLVWVTEVMPVDSVVVEHPSGPPPESVAEAAGRAVGRVRITEGAPLAVETVAGERPALVAAAHHVAADRDSLHVVLNEIVDVLEGGNPTTPAASIVEITTALDDLTRVDEAGRRVERIVAGAPAILAARPARPRATDDTRTATASAVLATTDADAIRDAFVVALLAETGDGSLDVAVDLGTLLSSPLLSDPLLPDPGLSAVASWSAVHPWSVTDGTPLDLGTDDDPTHAGAWFAVLRHGHRGVRKAVKRVADGPALLTGSRGVSARPSIREGDEADHGIVGRFRVADDAGIDVLATTEITVLATDADLAERLAAAWVSAIAERG